MKSKLGKIQICLIITVLAITTFGSGVCISLYTSTHALTITTYQLFSNIPTSLRIVQLGIYCSAYYIRFKMVPDNWFLVKYGLFGMTLAEFCIGVFCLKGNWLEVLSRIIKRIPRFGKIVGSIIIWCGMIIGHTLIVSSLFIAPVTGLIIIVLFTLWKKPKLIESFFLWMGRHSTNIWLIHMFFYLHLFKDLVYIVLAGNGYTQELTAYEKTRLVERTKAALIRAKEEDGLEIKGKMRDLVAAMLNESSTNVARMESINNNATPEIKEQLKNGNMGITAAYEAAKLPEDEQREIAEQAAGGSIRAKEIAAKVAEKKAGDDYETPHPESITSLCYSCQRYKDCNVKTGTCEKCDQYINKAEEEKTDEQRYNEEQDSIRRSRFKTLIMTAHIDKAVEEIERRRKAADREIEYKAFEMYFMQGMDYAKIAEELDTGNSTPRRWITAIINELSVLLWGMDEDKIR